MSYCQEKFTDQNGHEVKVCWRSRKHSHQANISKIAEIQQWLHDERGGTWQPRTNSFESGLGTCSLNAAEYDG